MLTKTDYVVKLDDMKYNMFEFLQGQVRVILFYVLLQGKFTHFIYFLSSWQFILDRGSKVKHLIRGQVIRIYILMVYVRISDNLRGKLYFALKVF